MVYLILQSSDSDVFLNEEKVLIVGLGEVGHALFDLFEETGRFQVYGFDVDKEKMQLICGKTRVPDEIDFMHICYPSVEEEKFVETTMDYIRRFQPKLTIIESTVTPSTTEKISRLSESDIAYSPIRGMHTSANAMKRDILFWRKYVSGTTRNSTKAASEHFEKLGLSVEVLGSPVAAELAKLFETIYRAWMIACFQEMHRISRHFGADFNEVVQMLEDEHRIVPNKPLHYPDVIGGHCLIPNTKLLLSVYDSAFLKLILKSNAKRQEEVKDTIIQQEISKIRKRVAKLERDLTIREAKG